MTAESVPWSDLSERERENFADMLNRRFNAGVTTEEAKKYYGNPEKIKEEFGELATSGGPQCPECFSPLVKADIPHLKRTGECPNCGATLVE